jgi:hypothetical protein
MCESWLSPDAWKLIYGAGLFIAVFAIGWGAWYVTFRS